jgi:hypothetical protein
VLRDADRSLASWLGQLLPPGVGLRFETPDSAWLSQPPEPLFLSVFLHSIRQDARGRQSGWEDLRDPDGRVVGRRTAAPHYRLSYLITAWAASRVTDSASGGAFERAMAEHELLGLVVDGCASHGLLPDDCLEGALADGAARTMIECATADSPDLAAPTWTGLRIGPRAHLELVLVAPGRPLVLAEVAPPAREIVLNAGQKPTRARSQPSPVSSATPVPSPLPRTLRRWEKQTITESGPPPR